MTEPSFYNMIAPFYDALNGDVDHRSWADLFERVLHRFPGKVESVLDLGTGTGSLALELAARGYDMIGVDRSEEMLSVARDRAEAAGLLERILWLCQDMTEFELYGTVEAVTCCLDGINHLQSRAEVLQCFSLVHNYLVGDGLFLFDVNSPYKFRNVYGDRDYVLEDGDVLCTWQNDFHPRSGFCDFYISLFAPDGKGKYKRWDSVQREQMYTDRTLQRALAESGFRVLEVFGSPEGDPPTETSERLYYLASAVK